MINLDFSLKTLKKEQKNEKDPLFAIDFQPNLVPSGQSPVFYNPGQPGSEQTHNYANDLMYKE